MGLALIGLHRTRAIFFNERTNATRLSIRKLPGNLIVVEGRSFHLPIYQQRDLLYIICGDNTISVLNMATMEVLQPLEIAEIDKLWHISGVHNGVISVNASMRGEKLFITFQLPSWAPPVDNKENEILQKKSACFIENEPEKVTLDSLDSPTSNRMNDLMDQCCCPICAELFDSTKIVPRNLPCGHSFCEVCISENLAVQNTSKCPICTNVFNVSKWNDLSKNYALIGVSEQLIKSKVEPLVTCKTCEKKFASSSVCMCNKQDCNSFEQLLCINCALDGGHAAHAAKYDARMVKIRRELHAEVDQVLTQVEAKKNNVMERIDQLSAMIDLLKKNLSRTTIPADVINQIDSLGSDQDVSDYREIVRDLVDPLIDNCDVITDAIAHTVNTVAVLGLTD